MTDNARIVREAIDSIVTDFRILNGWDIKTGECGDYCAEVIVSVDKKTAIICPWWSGEAQPDDYLLHEILHVVLRATEFGEKPESEETTVQDIVGILDKHRHTIYTLETELSDLKDREAGLTKALAEVKAELARAREEERERIITLLEGIGFLNVRAALAPEQKG